METLILNSIPALANYPSLLILIETLFFMWSSSIIFSFFMSLFDWRNKK